MSTSMGASMGTSLNPSRLSAKGLGTQMTHESSLPASQNRAILITGLACACVSLTIVIVALRWFILMKRIFRHRLILFLVVSDTMKAIWYFVFAVVAISRGPVSSTSNFCQAAGFLQLLAVEASDFAILLIAVHTLLCIFRPNSKSGEGGLYPYRRWIYPVWLGPPVLAASLAFVNGSDAYVTSGTYCFLPKRPFWYRLALSWIPRYLIITTILAMYVSIYIYVHVKFRGFKNLQAAGSSSDSAMTSRRTTEAHPVTQSASSERSQSEPEPAYIASQQSMPRGARPSALRMHSYNSLIGGGSKTAPNPDHSAPWDSMSFITQLPLDAGQRAGIAEEDFAKSSNPEPDEQAFDSRDSTPTSQQEARKQSEAPTLHTNYTGETATSYATFDTTKASDGGTTDHLRNTRIAIRRQLRFLFIYPLIYILMWAFPFAQHALQYNDYYVRNPPFWLGVVSTCSVALQAGVNGVVFSWREKPWRRIDKDSRFSVSFPFRRSSQPEEEANEKPSDEPKMENSPHWWEAEGRKRRDSVWMGTDVLTNIAGRQNHQRTTTLTSINERIPT
jgi:G protein-coupled receptor GPR1